MHYNTAECKAKQRLSNLLQCFITSPVLVPSNCVRQHTYDVPAKVVLSRMEYFELHQTRRKYGLDDEKWMNLEQNRLMLYDTNFSRLQHSIR